ncbi:hypothetical protein BDZ45DRAFT_790872, partial [Acephala macrosclerotiorum]
SGRNINSSEPVIYPKLPPLPTPRRLCQYASALYYYPSLYIIIEENRIMAGNKSSCKKRKGASCKSCDESKLSSSSTRTSFRSPSHKYGPKPESSKGSKKSTTRESSRARSSSTAREGSRPKDKPQPRASTKKTESPSRSSPRSHSPVAPQFTSYHLLLDTGRDKDTARSTRPKELKSIYKVEDDVNMAKRQKHFEKLPWHSGEWKKQDDWAWEQAGFSTFFLWLCLSCKQVDS